MKFGNAGPTLMVVAAAFAACVWLFKVLCFSSSGKVKDPSGRVHGVVGHMGSGKSLYCVLELWRRLCAGKRVATNFTMSFSCDCKKGARDRDGDFPELHDKKCWTHKRTQWTRFTGWEQLASLRDCIVVLDEAHLYAPALSGFTLPISARWAISMCRKNRVDLYWITQHEDRVTKSLKDLTTEMVQCKRRPWGCQAKAWAPEDFRKKAETKRWLWSKTYRPKGKVITLYNSMELILPDKAADAEGLVDQLIARSAPVELLSSTTVP